MSGYIALPTMWTFDSWATVDGGRPTVRFHLKSDGSPGTELRTGPATDCQNCQNQHPAIVSPRGLNERTGTRTPHGASDPGTAPSRSLRQRTIPTRRAVDPGSARPRRETRPRPSRSERGCELTAIARRRFLLNLPPSKEVRSSRMEGAMARRERWTFSPETDRALRET